MCLPQAINFVVILEEVGSLAMGLEKLEFKRESVKGQNLPKWPKSISSAFGCRADINWYPEIRLRIVETSQKPPLAVGRTGLAETVENRIPDPLDVSRKYPISELY